MAARVKVEYVYLGDGRTVDGASENVIEKIVSVLDYIAVTDTATAAESRPVTPAATGAGQMYARVTALDAPVIVAWGADPTASVTSGLRLPMDQPEAVPVSPGELLSFLETT